MRRKASVLAVAICLLIAGTGTAFAKSDLTDFLNNIEEDGHQHYYQNHYSELTASTDFSFNPTDNQIDIIAKDEANSNDLNIIGWCPVTDTDDKNGLFAGKVSVGHTAQFSPNGVFELYLQPQLLQPDKVWYTTTSQNTDSKKHVRVFQIDSSLGGGYFLGFEDGNQNGAWDYQDLVIKLSNTQVNVPEFPKIALPIGAMLGLLFMIGHKRGNL
jgi:hypothetical protein